MITGSGRGIGKAIAWELAKRGYDIVVHHRHEPIGAKELADDILSLGRRVEVLVGDLTKEDVPSRLIEEAIESMGQLDVLVNNAGITIFQPFLNLTESQFEQAFRTDFRAPYFCAQKVAQWMANHQVKGSIINITSVHYERVNHADSIYGAMKSALSRLTESMAYELAPQGIRVNAVAPGLILLNEPKEEQIQTIHDIEQQIPLRRAGRPEDVAKAVAWLAGDDASYVTGITLRVDGGMNLPMMQALSNNKLIFF